MKIQVCLCRLEFWKKIYTVRVKEIHIRISYEIGQFLCKTAHRQ